MTNFSENDDSATERRDSVVTGWFSPYFEGALSDLGLVGKGEFAGVLSPTSEIGVCCQGVSAKFLDDAEDYYNKYQGFAYWRSLLNDAVSRLAIPRPEVIVEYGCGFGNATLPMLDIYPEAKIIASDVSPNLLSIMVKLLEARNLSHRSVAIAMDAQRPCIKANCADIVFGAAIMHHLKEPGLFIETAMRVLKPGGSAFFFEPFEGGLGMLRAICEEVVRESRRRNEWSQAMHLTHMFAEDMRPQIFRQREPGWCNRDDKWAFPRSVLDEIGRNAGAEVSIYPLHDNVGQFRRHFSYMLQMYGGMNPSEYPEWGWEIFDRFDKDMFSPEMLSDLAIEGVIFFRKLS